MCLVFKFVDFCHERIFQVFPLFWRIPLGSLLLLSSTKSYYFSNHTETIAQYKGLGHLKGTTPVMLVWVFETPLKTGSPFLIEGCVLVDRVVDVVLHMEVVLEDVQHTREHDNPKRLALRWIIHPQVPWLVFFGPARIPRGLPCKLCSVCFLL